ncbi:glycoside hydrolase family 32 protein [Arthrobacter sp. Y-9]|uniref:glycoside hydrolase family 32 protein n=1 Tax=Arthrobacter sp. Y-9 TaxID=3039385 RepID=UPI00241D09C5|nr:glycoside hydrolase family 32 protein [Arthrobacter sp. Y-9]WFR83315.1 glycoside hydrolase family 32 protein [Arthrobacter sp. Y-9]
MTETLHPLALVPEDELVARAESDPLRPRFHFASPAGWLNDPNGVSQWNGEYHLFYQYNPEGAFHHRIQWGHATSTDLVHWNDRPVALVPGDGPDDPDRDGCWSGVLVDDGGTPTLVYSGRHGERELPCVALGSPDLLSWTKDPRNPVIAAPPAGVDVTAFRDHCVWKENGRWRQLVGSGIRGHGGTAFLYESADLRHWELLGPLLVGSAADGASGDADWTGTMWECVDLFSAGSGAAGDPEARDVLVFSAWDDGVTHHPLYWTGRYAHDSFLPEALHRLDYGGRHFYAPQSFRDDAGRRIMFGWLQEARSDRAAVEAGWAGVLSVPRLLLPAADGSLDFAPVPELEALRRDHRTVEPRVLVGPERPGDLATVVLPVEGVQLDLELDAELAPGSELRLGVLAVRAAGRAVEETAVSVSRDADGNGILSLDRSLSSMDTASGLDRSGLAGPVPLPSGRVRLRVLVDRSAIEVFANGKPLTARVHPTLGGGQVTLGAMSGTVRLLSFDAWTMADSTPDGRTLRP